MEKSESGTTQAQALDIAAVQEFQRAFAAAREWEQFHTPKNLAMGARRGSGRTVGNLPVAHAGTVRARHRHRERARKPSHTNSPTCSPYVIRLADVLKIDLNQSLWNKLRLNEQKYPVALAKGNARKYSELSGA